MYYMHKRVGDKRRNTIIGKMNKKRVGLRQLKNHRNKGKAIIPKYILLDIIENYLPLFL